MLDPNTNNAISRGVQNPDGFVVSTAVDTSDDDSLEAFAGDIVRACIAGRKSIKTREAILTT